MSTQRETHPRLEGTVLVSPDELGAASVTLTGSAYRHLFRARRIARGALLRVVDGDGRARRGVVEEVGRESARLELREEMASNEAEREIELAVAVLRPERADWLVEKVTEIGVRRVVFLETEHAQNRRFDDKRLDRLRRVAGAAVEQSGRALLPELVGPVALERYLATLPMAPQEGGTLVLDARLPGTGPNEALALFRTSPLRVLVGPEGGWSEVERAAIEQRGIVGVCFGARVLRVETAAVVAAALALAC